METFWLIVFMGITIFIVFLLPTTIYYYEADDGDGNKNNSRGCEALKMEFLTVVVVVMVLMIMFSTLAQTNIPVRVISQNVHTNAYPIAPTLSTAVIQQAKQATSQTLGIEMDVSFPIYTTALMSFIGWFAFVIFGGIGLVALPMDLILYVDCPRRASTSHGCRAFVYRPKFMPADIYAQQKVGTVDER